MDCHTLLAMTGVRSVDCHASLAMTGVRSLDCHTLLAMTGVRSLDCHASLRSLAMTKKGGVGKRSGQVCDFCREVGKGSGQGCDFLQEVGKGSGQGCDFLREVGKRSGQGCDFCREVGKRSGRGCDFLRKVGKGAGRGGRWIALVALVVCNRRIGEGNQIFYLFILQERNGEAKMVCDMARNENGGLLRMEGSGRIRSGGQRCEIQGIRDQARS